MCIPEFQSSQKNGFFQVGLSDSKDEYYRGGSEAEQQEESGKAV